MTTEQLAAIKAAWQSDRSAKHVPALVAEVERLQRIEAAVVALFARHGGGDIEDFDGIVALRAALRAAGSGG